MNEFGFTVSDITKANIDSLARRQSLLEEQRICELAEIASSIADLIASLLDEGFGIYEALSPVAEELSLSDSTLHSSFLEENKSVLLSFVKTVCAHDKASLSRLIIEALAMRGIAISENSFFDTHEAEEIMAFVKNPLALEAYDVFSQEMKNPRLSYAKDMKETASKLKGGEAGYCILPLEERGGSRLKAAAELIAREDLKINSVTPVFGEYGTADMRYALVSRRVTVPAIDVGDDRYLEIRLKSGETDKLAELITVASDFDTDIYRINTMSYETTDGAVPYYSLVFKREGGDFTEILTYLTLYITDYTSVGIYKNLE